MKVGDPIGVVEAGYRLDGGFEEWLDGLLEAVAPSFDVGMGTVTNAVLARPDGVEHLWVRCRNARDDAEEVSRRVHTSMPQKAEMSAAFAQRLGLVTASAALEGYADNTRRWHELMSPIGVVDTVGILMIEGFVGAHVGGLRPETIKPTARDQALWDRVAIHLSHALRLRLTIGNLEDQASRTDAVLDPDGKLIHAESGVATPELRELLRTAVQRADKARTRKERATPESALDLWHGLVDGKWSLLDRFDSDGRRYVVACQNPLITPRVRQLTTREREAAQLAALGFSNAEAAYALGTSESTAASHTANALNKLNVARRAELVALWMTLAAQDAERLALMYKPIRLDAVTSGVASPPDLEKLTAAEKEVTELLAKGLTNAQIAQQRRASERTVANQLQSIFRKLGVSSRSELIARLGRESAG
ncbi:MAG: LuxR C-terminal-related transcriptional regulator [Polyangiaceae bacterium]